MTQSDVETSRSLPIRAWLERLIDHGEVDEVFYGVLIEQVGYMTRTTARHIRTETTEDLVSPEDLAGDFLLHLKAENKREIQTLSGLKREFSKFLTDRNDPESKELWEIISDALHQGGREGWARRLDDLHSEKNHNQAVWTSALPGCDQKTLDLAQFEQRAKKIPCFYPGRTAGRILPPSDAVELIRRLLKEAQVPIVFSILFNEARRHVVFGLRWAEELGEESEAEDGEKPQIQHADRSWEVVQWAREESAERGDRIWCAIQALKTEKVLCLYILPKHFLGQKPTLSGMGDFRRTSENSLEIMSILAQELKVERLKSDAAHQRPDVIDEQDDDFIKAWTVMIHFVAERLLVKCSEKGFNPALSS
jgi:hypothetical protein